MKTYALPAIHCATLLGIINFPSGPVSRVNIRSTTSEAANDADGESGDEALMLRYRAGDASAFDPLYARHRGGLFRFILRQCPQRPQAEEIFQEVWMSLIQGRQRYEVSARFRTFLYTIAHNRLIDHYRKHATEAFFAYQAGTGVEEDGAEDHLARLPGSRTDEPEVRVSSQQQGARLLQLLEALPAPQREAFLLYEEGGLSVEEIAAAAGITFEAAKSRLRYAVARLRAGLMEVMA